MTEGLWFETELLQGSELIEQSYFKGLRDILPPWAGASHKRQSRRGSELVTDPLRRFISGELRL